MGSPKSILLRRSRVSEGLKDKDKFGIRGDHLSGERGFVYRPGKQEVSKNQTRQADLLDLS